MGKSYRTSKPLPDHFFFSEFWAVQIFFLFCCFSFLKSFLLLLWLFAEFCQGIRLLARICTLSSATCSLIPDHGQLQFHASPFPVRHFSSTYFSFWILEHLANSPERWVVSLVNEQRERTIKGFESIKQRLVHAFHVPRPMDWQAIGMGQVGDISASQILLHPDKYMLYSTFFRWPKLQFEMNSYIMTYNIFRKVYILTGLFSKQRLRNWMLDTSIVSNC